MTDAATPRPTGAYALARSAPGETIYLAGQTAADPATRICPSDRIDDQTTRVIEKLEAVLDQQGLQLADVVKVSVFLADIHDFAAMDAAYARRFGPIVPARTTVQAGLAPGALIEMDAIACRPAAGGSPSR